MGLRPVKSHEKPTADTDWADGGADPLVGVPSGPGRPRPAAGPTISAPCRAPAGRRGRRPRTRGSAPPFPESGFSTLSGRPSGRGLHEAKVGHALACQPAGGRPRRWFFALFIPRRGREHDRRHKAIVYPAYPWCNRRDSAARASIMPPRAAAKPATSTLPDFR